MRQVLRVGWLGLDLAQRFGYPKDPLKDKKKLNARKIWYGHALLVINPFLQPYIEHISPLFFSVVVFYDIITGTINGVRSKRNFVKMLPLS